MGKKYKYKDILEIAGIIFAIIFSAISLFQSNKSIKLTEESMSTNLTIRANVMPAQHLADFVDDHNDYDYMLFPPPGGPFDISGNPIDVYFSLCFNILIQIDNTSLRDTSIRDIAAYMLIYNSYDTLYTSERTQEEGIGLRSYENKINSGLVELNYPFSLQSGEAKDVIGKTCISLSQEASSYINSWGLYGYSSSDFEAILRDQHIFLGIKDPDYSWYGAIQDGNQQWRPLQIIIKITSLSAQETQLITIP